MSRAKSALDIAFVSQQVYYITEANNFITQAGLDNSSAKFFEPNTLLVAMYGATAGKVSLLQIGLTQEP